LGEVSGRVERSLEQILREIAVYKLAYTYGKSGRIEFSFRDRVGEISKLIKFPYSGNPVAIVYGPKGCGKSELSRALLYGAGRAYDRGSSLEVLLLSEVRGGSVEVAFTPGFERFLKSVLGDMGLRYEAGVSLGLSSLLGIPGLASISLSVGVEPRSFDISRASIAWYALRRLRDGADHGKDYIVVVDEFRGATEGELGSFAEKVADHVGRVNIETLSRFNSTVELIITTSDAIAAREVYRSTPKFRKLLLWSLAKGDFMELVEELLRLGRLEDLSHLAGDLNLNPGELAWILFGGNVRELLEADTVGLKTWIKTMIDSLRKVAIEAESQGVTIGAFLEHLKRVLEDGVETLGSKPFYNLMLKANIALEVVGSQPISELPREPWVSEMYAFQIPAYYHIARAMVLRGELGVGYSEVLGVLEGSEDA